MAPRARTWQSAVPGTPVATGWLGRWLKVTNRPMRALGIGPTLPVALAGEGAGRLGLPRQTAPAWRRRRAGHLMSPWLLPKGGAGSWTGSIGDRSRGRPRPAPRSLHPAPRPGAQRPRYPAQHRGQPEPGWRSQPGLQHGDGGLRHLTRPPSKPSCWPSWTALCRRSSTPPATTPGGATHRGHGLHRVRPAAGRQRRRWHPPRGGQSPSCWWEPRCGGLYGEPPSLLSLSEGNIVYTTDFRSVYATSMDQVLSVDRGRSCSDRSRRSRCLSRSGLFRLGSR